MTSSTSTISRDEAGRPHITVDSDAAHIRFYLWLYDADERKINTCKLFWAYIFAPLVLLFRMTAWQLISLGIKLEGARVERRPARPASPAPVRKPDGPSRAERFITKVSESLSYFFAKFAPVLKILGIGLGIIFGLAVVGLLLYVAFTNPAAFFGALLFLVGVIVFIGLMIFVADRVSNGAGSKFFALFKVLFHAVHNNTCAVVDVKRRD